MFVFVVGFVGCFRLLSDLLGGAGVSAVGTTLLQSPGCNEGKARNATLGKHRPKRIELRRSGTYNTNIGALALIGCAAPWGLNKCVSLINPGLAPWAMQECRPCRAHLRSLLF